MPEFKFITKYYASQFNQVYNLRVWHLAKIIESQKIKLCVI